MNKVRKHTKARSDNKDLVYSIGLFVIISLAFIWAWRTYKADVQHERQERIQLMGQFSEEKVISVVNENIEVLKNLKKRIEFSDGYYFNYWEEDANLLLNQNSTFQFVEWIDSNMIIRKAVPREGNEAVFGYDISTLDYRNEDWIGNTLKNKVNFTPWLDLIQGGQAFLIDAPVFVEGKLWGSITAGMDFTEHVNDIFDERIGYHFHLFDHEEQLFYCSSPERCKPIDVDKSLIYSSEIGVLGDVTWKLQLFPTEDFFDQSAELSNNIGLFISIILSMALAVTLFLLLKYNRERKNVKQSNEQLTQLNEHLKLERERAEKASRAKTEFLASVSHEIRTPLNAIIGLISGLRHDADLNPEQDKTLKLVESSSEMLHGLLNNVLEVERIEAGVLQLNNEVFSPIERLQSIIDIVSQGNQKERVSVSADFQNLEDLWVYGDPVKFLQIITNLLRNALKFTDEGRVELEASATMDRENVSMKIVVSDTGIGIPEDKLDQIFDRFTYSENVYNKRYAGTGLGLSICKDLTDLMGGEISVESKSGQGSAFTVLLPFEKRENQRETEEIKAKEQQQSEIDRQVLVVEDNELNTMVLRKLLERMGVENEHAANGEEAVEMAKTMKFDLILMDLHMPVMDGFEASRKIRSLGIEIPIVAVSANATLDAIKDAKAAGMQDYISKPYSKDRIEEITSKYLKTRINKRDEH